MIEVMRLAEERGQVRGDRVTELHELAAFVLRQQLAVFAEALEVERAQATREASVYELAFLLREADAGDLAHERAQCLKVLVAELELAQLERECGGAGVHGGVRCESCVACRCVRSLQDLGNGG